MALIDNYLNEMNAGVVAKPVSQGMDAYLQRLNTDVEAKPDGPSVLEEPLNILKRAPQEAGASIGKAAGGVLEALGELSGGRSFKELGQGIGEFYRGQQEEALPSAYPVESIPGRVVQSALASTIAQGPMIGAGLYTALAAPLSIPTVMRAGLSSMGVVEGGGSFSDYRDKGVELGPALAGATTKGLAEGVFEAVPLGAFLKFSAKPVLKTLLSYGIKELGGEVSTTLTQDVVDKVIENPEAQKAAQELQKYFWNSGKPLSSEFVQNELMTIGTTLTQTLLMGGIGKAGNVIAGHVLEKTKADPTVLNANIEDIQATVQQVEIDNKAASGETAIEEGEILSKLREQVSILTEPITEKEIGIEGGIVDGQTTDQDAVQGSEAASDQATDPVLAVPELDGERSGVLPVLRSEPNSELVSAVTNHFAKSIEGDNLVVASPSLMAEANFAEDLLISTGVRKPVAILSRGDLEANSELHSLLGGAGGQLLGHLETNEPIASIARTNAGYIVVVNEAGLSDPIKLEAITHEAFGHVVAYEKFDSATPEQKSAIEADFLAFASRVEANQDPQALIREFFPFYSAAEAGTGFSPEYALKLQDGTNVGKEWLANQITKWATTNEKPLTLADKWFKKLAQVFKRAFKKQQNQSGLPVQSVTEWLDSIFDPSRLDTVENFNTNEQTVEPHDGRKKLSLKKEKELLSKIVRPEDLERIIVGKAVMSPADEKRAAVLKAKIKEDTKKGMLSINSEDAKKELKQLEGKYRSSISVSIKMADGRSVVMRTIKSTSRSSAQREAEIVKYRLALSVPNILTVESNSPKSKRIAYYEALHKQFKNVLQEYADDNGITSNQAWLDYVADPKSFMSSPMSNEILLALDEQGAKIFRRIKSVIEHNPEGARKSLLYEKRVISEEVQELAKVEEEVKAEFEAAPVEKKRKVIRRKKDSNENFKGKIDASLERLNDESAVETASLNGIPDDISDEEALMFLQGIANFARKAKTKEEIKAEKVKNSLYQEAKAPRRKKVLTPEQLAEKEAAKLERRSKKEREKRELLKTLIDATEKAKAKSLALTEYLAESGFSAEENLKMVRLYLQHQGSVFSQREQILRLAIDLGLYNSVEGDAGLIDFIKGIFPKSYGTLDTIGIRGRDIIVTRLQQLHERKLGSELDFTTVLTLRDVKAAKDKEFESSSALTKVRLALSRLIGNMQDGLETTPAGSQIVWNLKQILSAQYSLYARDYMTKLDAFKKEFPTAEARERVGEMYRNGEVGNTAAEQRAIALFTQITQSYGAEMERLGFKIYYDSKHQELFKHDPSEIYFPRIWAPGTFDDKNKIGEMINHLVKSGQAINEKEARKIINRFKNKYQRLSVPMYANMEMARETDMGGWIKDPAEVFGRYIISGSRRLAVMRTLGSTAEAKLTSMARDHYNQSQDPSSLVDAVNVIDAVVGSGNRGPKDLASSWLADEAQFYAISTMLQHSNLLQPGVAANVVGRIGWKNTLRGFSKILSPDKHTREQNKARAFALGVAERFIAKELFDDLRGEGQARDRADKLLNAWKVTSIDRWMRAGTALGAQMHIMEKFAEFKNGSQRAARDLRRLFIDPDLMLKDFESNNEQGLKDWIDMGSFQLTQQTNFATDALTTPQLLKDSNSPWLNLITLFSRFTFHQSKHWSGQIKHDPRRILSQVVAQTAIGAPLYLIRLLAKGIDPEKELEKDGVAKTLWGLFLSGSGLGLFAEAAINAVSGTAQSGGPVQASLSNLTGAMGKVGRAAFTGEDIQDNTYHRAISNLIDVGIWSSARFLPPVVGIPLAAGVGFVAPAIERNVIPKTAAQEKTNWTGR